jgi:hypothetical protein
MLSLLDWRSDEIGALHLVEFVDAADVVVVVMDVLTCVEGKGGGVKVEVLEGHRVGRVVEVVEVAAVE